MDSLLHKPIARNLLLCVMALLIPLASSFGDVVETQDGARLVGTLKSIDGGKITLETAYAGTLEIDAAQVASFSTDNPVFLRLESGNTMSGVVQSNPDGTMSIRNQDGTMNTTMDRVTQSWGMDEEDPRVLAEQSKQRKWQYRLAADVSGKGGNNDESSLGFRGNATLAGPNDKLVFYASYFRSEQNDVKTDDETIGGVRYESFVIGDLGWYTRAEFENDEFENLDLRSTAGGGLTYRFINEDNHNLTGRFGGAYRYQSFLDGTDAEDLTVDLGLSHNYSHNEYWSVDTEITLNPAISDFGDFVLKQNTVFLVPIPNTWWAFNFGFGNDYNSEPGIGFDEWDYRYFAGLTLDFDG